MKLPILKHLDELQKKAIEENKKTHDLYKKYKQYYTGDTSENYLNVIKGIIDTKTSLVSDFDAVSSVVPKAKSFANINQVGLLNLIANILDDCNKNILKINNFDTVQNKVVKDFHVYGRGVVKTVWGQDDENELGDVKIEHVSPLNYFPDTSAKKVQDCNYIFEKEIYSSFTLKKEYPQFADKIEKAKTKDETTESKPVKKEKAVVTVGNDTNTTQMYTDGGEGPTSVSQSKNITVWSCYLKDDSTFIDTKDIEKQELMFQYPNGRYLKWVDGASDYLLEDKPIDYPFGYPFDVIEDESSVKYLIELQDRINKAFAKIRLLVGGYCSFLAHTPDCGLHDQEIINQLTVEVEALGQMEIITNNTLSQLQSMIEYLKELKAQMYEIARINPQLISGKKEDGVKSGRMVEILNESPMIAINEVQKFVKNFIVSQGEKNIALIQLFYNVPRIIRLAGGDLAYIYPQQQTQEGQQIPPLIEIYKENAQKEMQAIETIQADLSIGEYDIDVIAGTSMPRSKAEKANLMLQLAQMGKIPDNLTGNQLLLDSLDIPDKTAIVEALQEAQAQAPKINMPLELVQKIFKDLPDDFKIQYLAQFGFDIPEPTEPIINTAEP